jgi:hypothetical protein
MCDRLVRKYSDT